MRMGSKTLSVVVISMLLFSCLPFFHISADELNSHITEDKSLSYMFFFTKPSFHEKTLQNTRYTALDMTGCMAIGKRAGEPALPVKYIKLLLPPGKTVKNITLHGVPIEINTVDINLVEKPVAPYQNPIPIGEKPPEKLAFDNDIYNSLALYPSEIYGEQQIGYCRGYTLLSLALHPVQYVPGSGKVFYYPEITININLDENYPVNQFFRNTKNDEEWVSTLVNNPEMAGEYVKNNLPALGYPGGLCDLGDTYDYVIITTAQNGLDHWETNATVPYNWTSLMEKHRIDDDLNCTLVTIEAIDACSNYWNATSLFNDTAAHIREFCKDAYQDWGTRYIFIGGDDEWITSRKMAYAIESDVDSDIYWSNLDNTYNADHDAFWGEEEDAGFDLYSELFIGRITCDTPQDVSNWMKKSFYYADAVSTDYLASAAFYGGRSGWACEGDDFIDYSAINGTDDWLGPSPGSHGSYPSWLGFQYGFETWNANNLGAEYNLSVKWSAAVTPNLGWQGGSQSAAIAGLKDAINNDQVTLISAMAHADEYHSMDVSYMSWESDYHNTKPFFLHDYGCHCGDMDAADDGVLHSMLFHSDTELAFACVYNTCYGWGSYNDTNSSSALQQKLFWDYLFDTVNNSGGTMNWQLGKAMAFSKDSMAPTVNWTYAGAPGSWRAIIEGCLLFGDPAQMLKPPTILDHNVGVQNIDVDTTNPAKPNERIYVNTTVYNNGGNNETNVNVSFRINGTVLDFINFSHFERQTTQQISFNWTPSAGVYLVTINVTAPEITEDIYTDNEKNHTVMVGVKNLDTGKLFDSIQEAINDSDTVDGHRIFVPCGTYQEPITINKNISLQGSNKATTILKCNESADSVISINDRNHVNITKFTIQNGNNGVFITSSSHVTITSTDIFNHTLVGVCLNSSENNTITDNIIYNNTVGINLTNSSNNNTMNTNEINENHEGLKIEFESNYNSIYHNNFNNSQNAIDDGNHNEWDNGCQSGYRLRGGNWWSNYTGIDGNSDGIGDTPYNISGLNNSKDNYPLIEPWAGALNGTIYVNDDNTIGPWDGTMDHPYQHVQDAIDDAFDHDAIFVYNGTYQENIVIDKSVNLNGENKNSTIIDADGSGTVISISADGVTLTGFTIQNSGDYTLGSIDWKNMSAPLPRNQISDYCAGIQISSSQNTIYGNIITNNSFGILELEALSNNNISYNTIKNNYYEGMRIGYSSDITIVENILTNNTLAGIDLGYLSSTTIIENTISNNTEVGMELFALIDTIMSDNIIVSNPIGLYLLYSSGNSIFLNNLSDSSFGMLLDDSYNNNIFRNNITNNSLCGILSFSYGGNTIYHNNFIHNSFNAFDYYDTIWDNSTLQSGNYWDDFDEPSEGAYDNNHDGIVDSPYDIYGGYGRDLYPLTGPVGERPDQPVCLQPSDGATGVSVSPTLQVQITDPNNDIMTISFYDASTHGLIRTNTHIASGNITSTTWLGREYSTSYSWYVIINDGEYFTKSETWSFTTQLSPVTSSGPPPPPVDTKPATPKITGPTKGYVNVTNTYTTNTTDPDGHPLKYNCSWGDGTYSWTNTVPSGTPASCSHIWKHPGIFLVKVQAQDTTDNDVSGWSSPLSITITQLTNNTPPNTPSISSGPTEGCTSGNYSCSTSTTDPDEDHVQYRFDWGDGIFSNWTSLVSSGDTTTVSHRWRNPGNYSIRAQAQDSHAVASAWSSPLNITIELDIDGDGWSDTREKSYGTNSSDPSSYPLDTDHDGIPDDFSPDGRYPGDDDDDNDGLKDTTENALGSDPKNKDDVLSIPYEGSTYYLIDTNADKKYDTFYTLGGKITTLGYTDKGEYLIDIEGDNQWNYVYDPATSQIRLYEQEPSLPWLFIIIGIIVIVGIATVLLALLFSSKENEEINNHKK